MAFLCVAWLVFYVNTVPINATTVMSGPLVVFVVLGAGGIIALTLFVRSHDHSAYPAAVRSMGSAPLSAGAAVL
jgi:hypothetical protein